MILIHKDWNVADNISDVITSVLSENINSIKKMMFDISSIPSNNWDDITGWVHNHRPWPGASVPVDDVETVGVAGARCGVADATAIRGFSQQVFVSVYDGLVNLFWMSIYPYSIDALRNGQIAIVLLVVAAAEGCG